jgi:hypothetical protein
MKNNQKGFGAIGIVLLIIVVAIVAVVGWVVHRDSNAKNTASNIVANISPAGPNTTSSWKTECLSSFGLCIKHPSDWSLGLSSSSGFTLSSADNTAFVQVEAAPQTSTPSYRNEKFYTTTQDQVYTAGLPYKVLGGYTVGEVNNSPSYAIVTTGFGGLALKVNTAADIPTPPLFSYLHNNSLIDGAVKLLPVNGVPTNATPQQSTMWLNSPTAQTGLQILKSITTS